jgi:hypothetical protein
LVVLQEIIIKAEKRQPTIKYFLAMEPGEFIDGIE